MRLSRECIGPWWVRYRRTVGIVVATLLVVGTTYGVLLHQAVENRQQRRTDAAEQRADTAAKVTEVCNKINELPAKLARAIELSERRGALAGTPTTTVPLADLTPAERAELAQINAELTAILRDLGRPVDCSIRSITTTTTRRAP